MDKFASHRCNPIDHAVAKLKDMRSLKIKSIEFVDYFSQERLQSEVRKLENGFSLN